jgi:hypothetical protein
VSTKRERESILGDSGDYERGVSETRPSLMMVPSMRYGVTSNVLLVACTRRKFATLSE